MAQSDPYDRPRAQPGRTAAVNPQDTIPQERIKQPEITTKASGKTTEGITTSADGKTSFSKASGHGKQLDISRKASGMTTPGITKSADGKTSFKRV